MLDRTLVKRLAGMPRPPASAGARRAAELIGDRLRDHADAAAA